MTREEALRALEEMAASPAAAWIGNKFVDGGSKLLQKCTRCGAEQTLELPARAVTAFQVVAYRRIARHSTNRDQAGKRGDALAGQVPIDFDATLFTWKRAFQLAHESCVENAS